MCEIGHRMMVVLAVVTATSLFGAKGSATEGQPLAVRQWPEGIISLETQWGLTLAITPAGSNVQLPSSVDHKISAAEQYDHVLTRLPNETKASWFAATELSPATKTDTNVIRVRSWPFSGTSLHALMLTVDGVSIVVIPGESLGKGTKLDSLDQDEITVLVLTIGESSQLSLPAAVELVRAVKPSKVLINSTRDIEAADLSRFETALDTDTPRKVAHNTLAVSSGQESSEKPQIVLLANMPWQMPEALQAEFAAMEADCTAAQEVFAKLSIEQLNFQPGNGTHTPRWNCEHMMGRQLLFFSQIYHALDPTIPIMDLNPAQMPPDYRFAHPDWTGAEEARQMQRVSDFTRRFAYLLEDLQLDEPAPGSRWPTLGALLKQMQRHYSEHTANTIKKFELPDWPQE